MRRILSMLLLVVFGLPVFAPLLAHAAAGEVNLPACCRRNGSHHCMMTMLQAGESTPASPALRSPRERCPYCPATVTATHTNTLAAPSASLFDAVPMHQPAAVSETQPQRLSGRDRSRSQRGPPPTLFA